MDIIKLMNLKFYGYHGVLEEEKKIGQKFIINLELYADLNKACMTDDVNETISYAIVYDIVKNIVENKKFDLIEKLGYEIINEIFKCFDKAEKIMIEVKKPEAPVNGIFDYFSICLERNRNE
jgi:dihydroneopterin aldolase